MTTSLKSIKLLFSFFMISIWSSNILAVQCPTGKYPVKAHIRTDYYRNDGTYVSGTNVSETCREYRELKLLSTKFLVNVPKGLPHKKEKFRSWTKKEKADVTKAFNELPAILTQVGELKIYRAIKSEIQDNPSTSAPEDKIITIYDNVSKHELKRVLAHELAHILYVSLSKQERESYCKAARWELDKSQNIYTTERKSFSADDGKINPEEDFANNVESFYFQRKEIEKDLDIYKWIQKIAGEE